jgi:hypothetical protein
MVRMAVMMVAGVVAVVVTGLVLVRNLLRDD